MVAGKIRNLNPNAETKAKLLETKANLLCRDLFPSAGFVDKESTLALAAGQTRAVPKHVDLLDVAQLVAVLGPIRVFCRRSK